MMEMNPAIGEDGAAVSQGGSMNSSLLGPVLVTGTSSGIGFHLAGYLAERGIHVFGTVRKAADAERLGCIGNVTPLLCDVTHPDEIADAVRAVTRAGRGLYGLVNNAGLGDLGMLSTWTDEEMLRIFDVNVLGPHRMVNAFLPLLLESKGRIVNIGSQGGMLSKPYYGPYTMTKHALESYTETLRLELEPYGVLASIVQPGGIATGIGEASLPSTIERFRRAVPPFREEAEQILEYLTSPNLEEASDEEAAESETNRKPSSPEIVSAAVFAALTTARPKLWYLVGTKWEGDRVIHALVEKLLDENDNPKHGYSREQLLKILDGHLESRTR
jgi:NAD(P)-dependent dehydrogenase (short-subunit alcohol dehydrogenase family)